MLIKLYRWLVGGCDHQWKIIAEINIYAKASNRMPCSKEYHLQCVKCGNIKVKGTA